MPFVRIHNWRLSVMEIKALSDALPLIVAQALHVEAVPDAHLTTEDIEVKVFGPNEFDRHGDYEYGVSIEAKWFEEREVRLPIVKRWIKKQILQYLSGFRGYVWVTLPKAEFEDIDPFDRLEDIDVELPAA